MQLAHITYTSTADSKAVLIRIIMEWARNNRIVFQGSTGKLTRLTKKQLLYICDQLRYTPNVDTNMARNVFAGQGISVRGKTQLEIDNGY